jgi:hypothetical protein
MPSVSNTLLTISMITKEALRVLENSLVVLRSVNREYDDKFAVDGAKIGSVVNVRKPPQYLGRSGPGLQLEDSTETSVPLTLDTQFGVDIQFSSADLALSIDDFSNRFLKPAVATVANKMDSDVCSLYAQLFSSVGTPGTTPNDLLTYLLAGVALDNNLTPRDNQRELFLTPIMQAYIVNALKGLFQQANAIAEQYMEGKMGRASGFDWSMSQNLYTHTVGTYGGTPLVNGANQTGASIITDGWSSGATTLNYGDIFTLDKVHQVNRQSRLSNGTLQQFVVTSQISDTAGAITIPIYPPIITAGAFQTVDISPADNAPLTMFGPSATQSPQGLALHKDCITFASADLPLPRGVDMAARMSDDQVGVSIRMVRAYDINTDNFPCRLDVLYGAAVLRPELGCRVQSGGA